MILILLKNNCFFLHYRRMNYYFLINHTIIKLMNQVLLNIHSFLSNPNTFQHKMKLNNVAFWFYLSLPNVTLISAVTEDKWCCTSLLTWTVRRRWQAGTWWTIQSLSPAVPLPHTGPGRCDCGLSGLNPPSLLHKSAFQWRRAMKAPGWRNESDRLKILHQLDFISLSSSGWLCFTHNENFTSHRPMEQRTRTHCRHCHVVAAKAWAHQRQQPKKDQRPESKFVSFCNQFSLQKLFLTFRISVAIVFPSKLLHSPGKKVTWFPKINTEMRIHYEHFFITRY